MSPQWATLSPNEIADILDGADLDGPTRQFLEDLFWNKVQEHFGPAPELEPGSSSVSGSIP